MEVCCKNHSRFAWVSIISKEFTDMTKQTLSLQGNRAGTSYTFDYLVFIGRFQPYHLGHHKVVESALKQAERVVILIGSSYQPRSIRNPWTFPEREQFIRGSFPPDRQDRLIISPLQDDVYNDQNWLSRVQQTVHGIICQFPARIAQATTIGLIGHSKDHTSYYLSLFPQWQSIDVQAYGDLNATELRQQFFLDGHLQEACPPSVNEFLQNFQTTKTYQYIADEWAFIRAYQQGWEHAPYPPTFVTVDAVVVQSGHVLLVERKARPGKGLLALPGGFVNQQERLQDAVIRELREETRIKVPAPVLAGSISREQVFDDPHRSSRGRTITHAYLLELKPDAKGLPKVKGGDDAAHAFWVPLGDLDPENMFEDHFHIINAMLG
jgi:bifunctional NMN adenylyltransferase/nudix hydrolase